MFLGTTAMALGIFTQTRSAFLDLTASKEQVAASTTETLRSTYELLDLKGGRGVLSPDIVKDFTMKADEIAKALDASPNRKQNRRLLKEAVNLKYRAVRAADLKMMKARLESYHDAKTELSPVPTAASIPTPLDKKPVIYCLKESPILDCIHGEQVSLIADVIDREYFVHSESTVDSLRIGPLPEDWFVEPAALQIKFNGLVSSLPARTKGAETDLDNLSSIDVIAYDSDRSIYVEFPTLADAMAFIDRWIDMAAMPPPGLESTSCNVFD